MGENGVGGCVGENGVRGNSLEGYTERSGRNPGHSPGAQAAGRLAERQYLAMTITDGEVLHPGLY